MRLILDTNFVLIPFAQKVDIFEEANRVCPEYQIAVVKATLDELQALKTPDSGLALQLLAKKTVEVLPCEGSYADDAIVAYCKQHTDTAVATQDKELKERLNAHGIQLVVLRNKTHLERL
ncbi:MAG: rRNA-processing protein FCF1 [Candidatus Woesearchaeota archaeon]|jgi:rRNA-processing protein FCF1